MPRGLIAVCGDRREPQLKRMPIGRGLLDDITGLFRDQEEKFREGCHEIPFGGTSRADADEIMTLPLPPTARILDQLLRGQPVLALDTINPRNIVNEGLRGLVLVQDTDIMLVQKYYSSQTIRPRTFMVPDVDGVNFRRTDSSALTFDSGLVCIVENDTIKFKSLQALSRVVDTTDISREATAEEIREFIRHPLIDPVDADRFESSLNQVSRKLIYAIQSEGMLADRTIQSLQDAASQTEFSLNVVGDRIQMPTAGADIKALLRFLNDDLFTGAISGANFMTNAKRRR